MAKKYNNHVLGLIASELSPMWNGESTIPAGVFDTSIGDWITKADGFYAHDPDYTIDDDLARIAHTVISECKRLGWNKRAFLDPVQITLVSKEHTKNQDDNMRELVTGYSRPLDIAIIARFDRYRELYADLVGYDFNSGSAGYIRKKLGRLEEQLTRVGGDLQIRKIIERE